MNIKQTLISAAEVIDIYKTTKRLTLGFWLVMTNYTILWYMRLPDPSAEQTGFVALIIGAVTAAYAFYTNRAKVDWSKIETEKGYVDQASHSKVDMSPMLKRRVPEEDSYIDESPPQEFLDRTR